MTHLEQFKAMLNEQRSLLGNPRDYEERTWNGETIIVPSQPKGVPRVEVWFDEEGKFADILAR